MHCDLVNGPCRALATHDTINELLQRHLETNPSQDAKKQTNENANMSVLHLYNPLHDDAPSAYAILFHQHEPCAGTDIATNS